MAHINYIDWHTTPFRSDRWLGIWAPALDRALAFGASTSYMTRNIDDPLHFRQVSIWEDMADFERYWASDEVATLRQAALNYYGKPVIPSWHSLAAEARNETPAETSAARSPLTATRGGPS